MRLIWDGASVTGARGYMSQYLAPLSTAPCCIGDGCGWDVCLSRMGLGGCLASHQGFALPMSRRAVRVRAGRHWTGRRPGGQGTSWLSRRHLALLCVHTCITSGRFCLTAPNLLSCEQGKRCSAARGRGGHWSCGTETRIAAGRRPEEWVTDQRRGRMSHLHLKREILCKRRACKK